MLGTKSGATRRGEKLQRILDEMDFINRGSEGAIKHEFILTMPVSYRISQVKKIHKELEERMKHMKGKK